MPTSLHPLIAEVVDYAGLFPPAELPMQRVVSNYAEYRDSPEAWMLGRLIVPLGRLAECATAAHPFLDAQPGIWRISCLLPKVDSTDIDPLRNHWRKIGEFNTREAGRMYVDAIEVGVTSPDVIPTLLSSISEAQMGGSIETFVEIPRDDSMHECFRQLGNCERALMRAKIRTGGVTENLFPAPEVVSRFLSAAVYANVPFKATAGLHHPLRAEYPISYEDGCRRVLMHGFLNMLMASTLLFTKQVDESQAARLLDEPSIGPLQVHDDSIAWRDWRVSNAEIAQARQACMRSFGSCSFIEPVEDLQGLGYLPEEPDDVVTNRVVTRTVTADAKNPADTAAAPETTDATHGIK